jgi:hypothetical protein
MPRGRPRQKSKFPGPTAERLEIWAAEMREGGETPPAGAEELRKWMRSQGEKDLWWFSRWILDNTYLSLGTFHRAVVCPYLTDYSSSRFKLLMLPMGCLKTTVASRSLPLHALIQPSGNNKYFSHMLGRNTRILLGNENEQKSMNNLGVCKTHLEQNPKLRWCWPECVWPDGKAPSGYRWKDTEIQIPRTSFAAEPSITAKGIKTGFIGDYYDIIVGDDLAALEASQNPPLMERAKKWRRAAKTRFYDKQRGIFIGAATHWGMDDMCVEWQKDTDFSVMVRSIVERDERGNEVALWPEKYPLDEVEKMRKGMNPIEFTLWFMNKPIPTGFTALRWADVREYESVVLGDAEHPYEALEFSEAPIDEVIMQRHERITSNLHFRLGTPLIDLNNQKLRKFVKYDGESDYRDQMEYLRVKYPDRMPKDDEL